MIKTNEIKHASSLAAVTGIDVFQLKSTILHNMETFVDTHYNISTKHGAFRKESFKESIKEGDIAEAFSLFKAISYGHLGDSEDLRKLYQCVRLSAYLYLSAFNYEWEAFHINYRKDRLNLSFLECSLYEKRAIDYTKSLQES